jgi:aryl-alcohol dehydrogenase-like predicted oxidoreductase
MPFQLTASKPGLHSPDRRIAFALGLLEIGKPWGHLASAVPSEKGSHRLLERAWELGIRHFDTAPSYNLSEERFGRFLRGLGPDNRRRAFVATKFGEHWDRSRGEPYVDHSFEALARSADTSVERLGSIDLLQLHKTTPEVLASRDLERGWEYCRKLGIEAFGASVKDSKSAAIAISSGLYAAIQLPFNAGDTQFADVIGAATEAGVEIVVNRPFGMGKLLHGNGPSSDCQTPETAFRFIMEQRFRGLILVGTKSPEHLLENVEAFCATSGSPAA